MKASEIYRAKANELREQGRRQSTPSVMLEYYAIAEMWDNLANIIEKHDDQDIDSEKLYKLRR